MWRASWCRRPNCWPPPTSPTRAGDPARTERARGGTAGPSQPGFGRVHRTGVSGAGGHPGVDVEVFDNADGQVPDLSLPADPSRRRIVFLFHSAPEEIIGDSRVDAVAIRSGGTSRKVATDLVVRSIGYRSTPIPGLAFDDERVIVISNDDGRLLDESGRVIPGGYVVGWGQTRSQRRYRRQQDVRDRDRGGLHRRRRLWQADPALARAPRRSGSLVRKRVRNVIGCRGTEPLSTVSERRRGAAQGVRASSSPSSRRHGRRRRSLPSLMALFEVMPSGVERSRTFRDPALRRFGLRDQGVVALGRILVARLQGQSVVAIVVGMRLTPEGDARAPGVRVVLGESRDGDILIPEAMRGTSERLGRVR